MGRNNLLPLNTMNPQDVMVNSSGRFQENADLSDSANYRAEAILAPLAKLSSNGGDIEVSRTSVFLESQMLVMAP